MSEGNAGKRFIVIAEMLHASIPAPGKAMKAIHEMGDAGFSTPSESLDFMKNLIAAEGEQGSDFIDINVDALVTNTPQAMRKYVRLVKECGRRVPPCIDSSNVDVLIAGIEEWYTIGGERKPMLNSITYHEHEKFQPILNLRAKHPFNVICLLSGPEGTLKSPDEIHGAAKEMFRLTTAAGFKPDEIFFDVITLAMTADSCMDGMGEMKATHTRNAFLGIQKIKQDPAMKGVRSVQGVSNWVYGVKKRRVGHIRAYIAVGQEYGLDGAICDAEKRYGVEPAPQELADLVRTFVSLDGSEDCLMTYSAAMQNARQNDWL